MKYYIYISGFNILGEIFLAQLHTITSCYYDDCLTIYHILQNSALHKSHTYLKKILEFL